MGLTLFFYFRFQYKPTPYPKFTEFSWDKNQCQGAPHGAKQDKNQLKSKLFPTVSSAAERIIASAKNPWINILLPTLVLLFTISSIP
jgi:hypothetical protein